MHYGKVGATALPMTGIAITHSVLLAITLITMGIVLWQVTPRMRRRKARR
jgi:hypothetical protein